MEMKQRDCITNGGDGDDILHVASFNGFETNIDSDKCGQHP